MKINNKIISNFSYMFIIEMANYILPFLVIPYIVRIVGVEKYGIITFSYVIIAYFNLIVDYGFKLIIIKDISRFRNSPKKLSFLFWKMYISQGFLLLLSLIIFFIVINNFPMLESNREIFIYTFLIVIGNFLFPIWFFQGIEKMKYLAIFDFLARLLYVSSVFIFIKQKSDFLYVPLLNGCSFILIGIISLIMIYKKHNLLFLFPNINQLKKFFKEGWHLFVSSLSVNLYSKFNILLLGIMSGYQSVGIYSLAEKVFGAVMKVIGILNVVFFPHLSAIKNKLKLREEIQKLIIKYLIIVLPISFSLFIISTFLITLLFGENNQNSIFILKIMSFILIFAPFGQLFTNYLIIKKQNQIVTKITLLTMFFNMIIVFPMIYFFNEIGLAISILIVQIFQVILNVYYNKEIFK